MSTSLSIAIPPEVVAKDALGLGRGRLDDAAGGMPSDEGRLFLASISTILVV